MRDRIRKASMKNYAFVSSNKAAQELFTEFKFHEVQLMSLLIGWQAYRGDQIHRKNSPT